jgi:hypothetical protein
LGRVKSLHEEEEAVNQPRVSRKHLGRRSGRWWRTAVAAHVRRASGNKDRHGYEQNKGRRSFLTSIERRLDSLAMERRQGWKSTPTDLRRAAALGSACACAKRWRGGCAGGGEAQAAFYRAERGAEGAPRWWGGRNSRRPLKAAAEAWWRCGGGVSGREDDAVSAAARVVEPLLASGGVKEAMVAGISGGGRWRIWGKRGEAGLEVDDGADGWAPSVGEKEREEGGWAGEMSGPEGRGRRATR